MLIRAINLMSILNLIVFKMSLAWTLLCYTRIEHTMSEYDKHYHSITGLTYHTGYVETQCLTLYDKLSNDGSETVCVSIIII